MSVLARMRMRCASLTALLHCRELLDGLHKIGFRTHLGPDGSGFLAMARRRGGGYYLGASHTPPASRHGAQF